MAEQLLFKQKLNFLVPQLHNSSRNSPNPSASFSLIIFLWGKKTPQKSKKMHASLKKPLSLLPPCLFVQVRLSLGHPFGKALP